MWLLFDYVRSEAFYSHPQPASNVCIKQSSESRPMHAAIVTTAGLASLFDPNPNHHTRGTTSRNEITWDIDKLANKCKYLASVELQAGSVVCCRRFRKLCGRKEHKYSRVT